MGRDPDLNERINSLRCLKKRRTSRIAKKSDLKRKSGLLRVSEERLI